MSNLLHVFTATHKSVSAGFTGISAHPTLSLWRAICYLREIFAKVCGNKQLLITFKRAVAKGPLLFPCITWKPAWGGGVVFEHKSPVLPARAHWCVCLGLDGCFLLSFSWTKEDCYSSLLSQSLGRSDLAAILAGLRRVLEVFYIPATFEECNSDFLLQPWPPSYSTVWATSASSKYLRNLSLIK